MWQLGKWLGFYFHKDWMFSSILHSEVWKLCSAQYSQHLAVCLAYKKLTCVLKWMNKWKKKKKAIVQQSWLLLLRIQLFGRSNSCPLILAPVPHESQHPSNMSLAPGTKGKKLDFSGEERAVKGWEKYWIFQVDEFFSSLIHMTTLILSIPHYNSALSHISLSQVFSIGF